MKTLWFEFPLRSFHPLRKAQRSRGFFPADQVHVSQRYLLYTYTLYISYSVGFPRHSHPVKGAAFRSNHLELWRTFNINTFMPAGVERFVLLFRSAVRISSAQFCFFQRVGRPWRTHLRHSRFHFLNYLFIRVVKKTIWHSQECLTCH